MENKILEIIYEVMIILLEKQVKCIKKWDNNELLGLIHFATYQKIVFEPCIKQ